MKQYLDFKENDVVSTDDGNYIDFFPEDVIEHIYYESEDEATMNYQVNYKRLEENKFRKNIIDDENKESDKIKKKKKIFLDDFNYTEKNNKEKKNKGKIKKESKFKEKLKNLNIFGRFLKSIEFLSRILFLLLVFFIIFTVFRYNKLNKNDEIKENSNIVVEEVKEEQPPNKVVINNENLTFKELMIARAKDLNNIIEGEKECINRLSNDKISIKKAKNNVFPLLLFFFSISIAIGLSSVGIRSLCNIQFPSHIVIPLHQSFS